MQMKGEYQIPAPRELVWKGLNDVDILKQCIPGCEEIKLISSQEMAAKVVVKLGPVKAKFSGKVTLSDLDPPSGYRISGEGSGGAAGFARGGATVALIEEDNGTRLTYEVDAQIGGKLAQIGARLIDATARSLANQFFGSFADVITRQVQLQSK